MWKTVGIIVMDKFFFSGSYESKLDNKNRIVIPQDMRYGLVEEGRLEFTVGMGTGGCLAIYRRSDINKIAQEFKKYVFMPKYQKFFTLFFSTLYHTTCDKVGRVLLPKLLIKSTQIKKEIVIAGVLNKIEIWPSDKYHEQLQNLINGKDSDMTIAEEAFSLLNEKKPDEAE